MSPVPVPKTSSIITWKRIKGDWKQINEIILSHKEQFTDEELLVIANKCEALAKKIMPDSHRIKNDPNGYVIKREGVSGTKIKRGCF